jgi:hypothetical protein
VLERRYVMLSLFHRFSMDGMQKQWGYQVMSSEHKRCHCGRGNVILAETQSMDHPSQECIRKQSQASKQQHQQGRNEKKWQEKTHNKPTYLNYISYRHFWGRPSRTQAAS